MDDTLLLLVQSEIASVGHLLTLLFRILAATLASEGQQVAVSMGLQAEVSGVGMWVVEEGAVTEGGASAARE